MVRAIVLTNYAPLVHPIKSVEIIDGQDSRICFIADKDGRFWLFVSNMAPYVGSADVHEIGLLYCCLGQSLAG